MDNTPVTEEEKPQSAQYWHDELQRYHKEFKTWEARSEKVTKRYRDERGDDRLKGEKRYNILWSNVQTLHPAIFSKVPKSNVTRRYSDNDPVGRTASTILERCLEYEIEQYGDYYNSVNHAVLDRLLSGRGVCWIRYEPEFEQMEVPGNEEPNELMITEDAEYEPETVDVISHECSPVDYVFWKDYAQSPARTEEEVTWKARRAYLNEEEGVDRFGKAFKLVPKKNIATSEESTEDNHMKKKAAVWEIWNKATGKVVWVAEGHPEVLDERDDPLQLEDFFPCPKPLFATMTNDCLIPIPDYCLYQNQADEMDDLSDRIYRLQEAMKLVGCYDAGAPELEKILKSNDNTLVPVKNWSQFVEGGGLQGGIQFVPIDMVAKVLMELYKARESVKQMIYEITGISDIIRGASMASETATAQQIKSQFASLRLNDMREDVEHFCRDILRIKAEIICTKYQPETILKISGIENTNDKVYAEQAIEMLKNEPLRNYRIEIETDSLVKPDQTAEQQNRVMFLQTAGQFLQSAIQVGQMQPAMVPLLGEMLMFGIRGFKTARPLEAAFEQFLAEQEKGGPNAQQQAQQQEMQARQQAEKEKMDIEKFNSEVAAYAAQTARMKAQIEAQQQANSDSKKLEIEAYNAESNRMKVDAEHADIAAMAEKHAHESLQRHLADIEGALFAEDEGMVG